MDKDESSDKSYHVVEGFVIEDSKSPFPVSAAHARFKSSEISCLP